MPKQIIAHRGAPRLAYNNTVESFQKALALGPGAVELDVRQTKDGVLVVIHDSRISWRRISRMTFQKLNVLASKKGFVVPNLAQTLKIIGSKAFVYIELKEQGYESKVLEVALQILKPTNFAVISFKANALKKIKQTWPKISVGLILKRNNIKVLTDSDFDFFAIHYNLWKKGFAKLIPKAKHVTVWTADKPELIQKLLKDKRIYGVTTNELELALKLNKQA